MNVFVLLSFAHNLIFCNISDDFSLLFCPSFCLFICLILKIFYCFSDRVFLCSSLFLLVNYFAPMDGLSLFLYDLIRFGLTFNPDPQLKEEKEVFSQNINMKFGKFPSTLIVTFWNTKRRSRVNNSNKKSQL